MRKIMFQPKFRVQLHVWHTPALPCMPFCVARKLQGERSDREYCHQILVLLLLLWSMLTGLATIKHRCKCSNALLIISNTMKVLNFSFHCFKSGGRIQEKHSAHHCFAPMSKCCGGIVLTAPLVEGHRGMGLVTVLAQTLQSSLSPRSAFMVAVSKHSKQPSSPWLSCLKGFRPPITEDIWLPSLTMWMLTSVETLGYGLIDIGIAIFCTCLTHSR